MFAVINGTVLTGNDRKIEGCTILIDGGKLVAVGENIYVPTDVKTIDARHKYVIPGLIDAHTHVGINETEIGPHGNDLNESTDPVTPHLRAIDAINPADAGMRDGLRGGVTSVVTGPGSANVIGGMSVAIKTFGKVIDKMILLDPAGMKMAFGENPKRIYGDQKKMPTTRMSIAAILREWLVRAQNYSSRRNRAEDDRKPDRDLKLEAINRLLNGEMKARIHCHRADDIMTAVRIADEFGFDITIEHGTEAHKVAHELAKRGISVVVGPALNSRSKVETRELSFQTPAILTGAGVNIALTTDSPVVPVEHLRVCAALAMKEGLSENEALRAITLGAARIAGIEKRVGSLEEGKDADIVILDGHPFDLLSRVEQVLVNGEVVVNRPQIENANAGRSNE